MVQMKDRLEEFEKGITPTTFDNSSHSMENGKLRQALVRLKEASDRDFKQFKLKISELEMENSNLAGYPDQLKEAEENIELLMEQLEVTEQSTDMIEELTNKNLQLGETISELDEQIKGLEEFRDYAEQLEAFNAEEISILKDDIGTYDIPYY
jgi:dynactin 1